MTFDLTFDATFQGLLIQEVAPTESGCRKPGVFLHWLSPVGWMGWLFESWSDTDTQVTAKGSYRRSGLTRYSQKEAGEVLTVRTRRLTKEQAEAVSTVLESISVYVLAPDQDGGFHPVPVEIEPGTFGKWRDAKRLGELQFQIKLPTRKSHRS